MAFATGDSLVPPVTVEEVADFARLETDDPTIRGSLIVATSLIVSYLKRDLINREYTMKINDFYDGQYDRGIYKSTKSPSLVVNLPMANLYQINEVKIDGLVSTAYTVIEGKQSSIKLDNYPVGNDSAVDDIYVNYIAGYGYSGDDVPEDIKQAVIMLASYVNLHRGCAPQDALMNSGAKDLLCQHAVMGGFVI